MQAHLLTASPWDVIVAGAGPAGCATAITLAKLGRRVLLAEQASAAPFKLGESLPPASVSIVQHFLGDLEPPGQSKGYYKSAGNIAAWTTDAPEITDFYPTQAGFGLCVERESFEEALRDRAMRAGAIVMPGTSVDDCKATPDGRHWHVVARVGAAPVRLVSRFLVDCTGRRASLAQGLGASVISDDPLFAYAMVFHGGVNDNDVHTRLEATRDGWWYSNRLPQTENGAARRIVVFHTDKSIGASVGAATSSGFTSLLAQTQHVSHLLAKHCYRTNGKVRGAPAGTQRLDSCLGTGWLAVGDAAHAFDPLSSQGIDKALHAASEAGHMVAYALEDSCESLSELGAKNAYLRRYHQQQEELWHKYVQRYAYFYKGQPRWRDSSFWARRAQNAHLVA